jgi:hypothetical protein
MPAAAVVDNRFARVVAHPLRHRLIHAYTIQTSSPSRVAAALGERVNVVSYHTAVLVRAGCLELVRTEPRRGATEHFYRATARCDIEDEEWERLPASLRRAIARRTLELIWRDAKEALPGGGMDDATSHVSRIPMCLDPQAEVELAALLRTTVDAAQRIAAGSRERADDRARPATLAILRFSSASAP